MIKITNISGSTVSLYSEELDQSEEKQLSDFERYDDLVSNYISLKISLAPYTQYFIIYCAIMEYQQLWQSYMNNVMSLSEVQTEATDRSIDTTGKSQDQLAKEVIEYECNAKGTEYLLQV